MKYDGFISYRHTELDMYVAQKIHKGLETYNPPRSVEKIGGKKTISRVFRDQEELPIGSDLDDNILAALKESEFLIVICSPRTPESHWVLKEIDSFIELHDRDHILAVLIEGEPEESFPKSLLTDDDGNSIEPLAADVRGANHAEINKKLKTELIRLAAPLLHCSYDNLKQRHRERKFKRIIACVGAACALIAGLGVGFGIYNANMLKQINEHYQQKQITQSKYLAETSLNLLDKGDRRSATLVALAALPDENNDRPLVPEAQYALSKALNSYDIGVDYALDNLLSHDLPVTKFFLSTDGKYTSTVDSNNNVFVWNNDTANVIYSEDSPSDTNGQYIAVEYVNVIDDKIVIITGNTVRILSLDGNQLYNKELNDILGTCDNTSTGEILIICYRSAYILNVEAEKITDSIAIPDNDKIFSATASSMSPNGRYLTLTYNTSNEKESIIYLYDRTSKKGDVKTYYKDYLSQTATGNDGTVFLLCVDDSIISYSSDYDSHGFYHIMAVNVDCEDEEFLWEKDYDEAVGVSSQSKSFLKARTVVDYNNVEHDCVVALFCNMLYCFDASSGYELSSTGYSNSAQKLLLSKNGYAIVAEENGKINYFNVLTGYSNEDFNIYSTIKTTDFLFQNGVMAIKSGNSPDITLMTTHQGVGCEELLQVDHVSTGGLLLSDDKKYYAIASLSNLYQNLKADFYDSSNDKLLGSLNIESDEMAIYYNFINDHHFIIVTNKGKCILYDINSDQYETFSLLEDMLLDNSFNIPDNLLSLDSFGMSNNKKFFAFICDNSLCLYDWDNRTCRLIDKDFPHINNTIAVTDDGKAVYVSCKSAPLKCVKANSETPDITVYSDALTSSCDLYQTSPLVLSPDNKYLALCCKDKTLRIVDVSTDEIYDEISLQTHQNYFVDFSDDSSKVFCQGDDCSFKVYSLPDKSVIHIATDSYGSLRNIIEYDDFIAVITTSEMKLLTKDTFSKEAEIKKGVWYVPSSNKVYLYNLSTLYSFPYRSLEELQKSALEKYQDKLFTDLEKIKYHIE